METAANSVGASVEWLSFHWVARFKRRQALVHIIGNSFPLNPGSVDHICDDKVATYLSLSTCSIPAVPHHLLHFPWFTRTEAIDHVLSVICYPLVVKPLEGSGGTQVILVDNDDQLRVALDEVRLRHRAAAVCPYINILDEYRAVVLDGECRILFRKRQNNSSAEWRHNLRRGAVPELVETPQLRNQLSAFSCMVASHLGVRFGSVDVVRTASGLSALEVNSSVLLNRFSEHNSEMFDIATRVYTDALAKCFETDISNSRTIPAPSVSGVVNAGLGVGPVEVASSSAPSVIDAAVALTGNKTSATL